MGSSRQRRRQKPSNCDGYCNEENDNGDSEVVASGVVHGDALAQTVRRRTMTRNHRHGGSSGRTRQLSMIVSRAVAIWQKIFGCSATERPRAFLGGRAILDAPALN